MRAYYIFTVLTVLLPVACKSKHHVAQTVNSDIEQISGINKTGVDSNITNINLSRLIELEFPEIELCDSVNGVKASIKCHRITVETNNTSHHENYTAILTDSIGHRHTAYVEEGELKSETSTPSLWKYVLISVIMLGAFLIAKILIR